MPDEPAENTATRIFTLFGFGSGRRARAADFHGLFLEGFDTIRASVSAIHDDGFVVFAASAAGIESGVWLRATPYVINAAVVGRHTSCHLRLGEDREISLRHAAIIVSQVAPGSPLRLRLVDLRTSSGVVDEHGRRWHNIESDGPLAVHLASCSLMAFPTGPSTAAWPHEAEEAWSAIPPRVYSDSSADESTPARRSWSAATDAAGPRGATLVRGLLPPVTWSRSLVAEGETARGELLVCSRPGEARLLVGARALRRGILLGRYDRCDNEGVPILSDLHISRVHVLVIEVDGQVFAVDTGSKNGLWREHQPVRRCALGAGEVVDLGGGLAQLTWISLH
jgi:hypothetical protein